MEDLISVIVPIYNVEKYICKCVNSILNQTYKNIEIFLVDDGSPDRCGKICDEYSQKDSRIRVIHKKNGGLSDARNVALDVMKGDYVTFIDSDDYIARDYISYLHKLIVNTHADISICEFKYVTEEGKIINHFHDNDKHIVMDREKALFELLNSNLFTNSAWGKLYSRKCFESIRYPYGRLYEDVPTTYKTFLKSNKIIFGARPLYYYLYREQAISKQKFNEKRWDAVEFAEEMTCEIVTSYPSLKRIAKCRLFDSYLTIFSILNYNDYPEAYSSAWNSIKECRGDVLFYSKSGKKRKLEALCSYFGPKILSRILNRG